MRLLSKLCSIALFLSSTLAASSQVAIGTGATAPNPETNAVLLLEGNGSQGIIIPKVSSLGTFGRPGMIVYNTSTGTVHYFNTAWVQVGSGAGGTQGIQIVGNKVLIGTGAGFSTEFSIAATAPGANGQILMWDSSLNAGAGGWTSSAATAPSAVGQVLKWNGSRWEPGTDNTGSTTTLSGDVSGPTNNSTISTTAGNSIAAALNNAATTSKILPAQISAGTAGQVLTTTGGVAVWAAPTGGTLPSLSANQLLSNNGTNTAINVTGDVGLSVTGTTGTFTIANNAITDSKVATGISAGKITTGTLPAAQVPNLDAAKITTGTFTAAQIPGLDASKITSGALTLANGGTGATTAPAARTALGLGTLATQNAVTTTEITDGTVAGADLANNITINTTGNITAANFTGNGSGLTGITATVADASITGGPAGLGVKLAANTITDANVLSLDAGKITSGTLPIARIAAGSIDNTKLATGIDAAKITTGTLPLAQVPVMTATVGGAVPTPPNNTTTFLRGDGTFAAPAGISLTTTGTSGAASLVGNTLNVPNYTGTTYSAGTGLGLAGNTFSLNTSQNISTLSNLTTNGLIKTTGGTGALSIATAGTDYLTPAGNAATTTALATGRTIALTGDVTYTSPAFDGSTNITGAATVARLQGRNLVNTVPTNGQVLKWNNTLTQWEPAADDVGGGATPTLSNGQILIGDGTSNSAAALSGDAQLSAGAITIQPNAVTSSKILDGTIAGADLANNITINTTGNMTAGTFTGSAAGLTGFPTLNQNTTGSAASFTGALAGDVSGTQGTTVIASNAVNSAKIADGSIAGADLANNITINTTGNITAANFTGNGSGLTGITATVADASITGGPAGPGVKLATNTITDANVLSLDAGKITSGALPIARIAAGTVDNTKLATGIDAAKITTGTLPVAQVPNLDAAKITTGTFPPALIPSLDASKIATGTLPINVGGTNSTATPTNGGVSYGTGSAYAFTPAGISGQILQSNGAAAPTWVNSPAATTASNGLTETGNDIALGGTLTGATNIANGGFNLAITGSGNMGIGTGTPASKLHVSGGNIELDDAGFIGLNPTIDVFTYDSKSMPAYGLGWTADSWNAGGGTTWFSGYSGFKFFTDRTLRMAMVQTGELGLGTDTPGAKLDIVGNIKIADGTQGVGKVLTSDATGLATWQNASGFSTLNAIPKGDGASLAQSALTDDGVTVTVNRLTAPTTIPSFAVINGHAAGDGSMRFTGGSTHYSIGSQASTGSFLISNSSTGLGSFDRLAITSAGNVGIGTTTPGATLDVRTNALGGTGALIAQFGSSAVHRLRVYDESFTLSEGPKIEFNAGATGIIAGAANLALMPAGANNVGIGTTTPVSKLDVSGDLRLAPITAPVPTTDKLYNVGGSLFWNGTNISSGGSGWGLTGNTLAGTERIGSDNAQPLAFETTNTERMRIDATGNVGVGTSTPAAKLDVVTPTGTAIAGVTSSNAANNYAVSGISNGTGDAAGFFLNTNAATSFTALYSETRGTNSIGVMGQVGTTGTGHGGVFGNLNPANTNEVVRISNSGTGPSLSVDKAILIANGGVPSPTTDRLYNVGGSLFWNGTNISSGGSGWGLTGNTLSGTERIGSDNAQPLVLETSDTERLRINATGNVGIGTTAPTSTLHVASTTDPNPVYITTTYNAAGNTNRAVLAQATGASNSQNIGITGEGTGGVQPWGVYGIARNGLFGNIGVQGEASNNNNTSTIFGVRGSTSGTTTAGISVGVEGLAQATGSSTNYGLSGYAVGSNTNYGVYATASLGTTNWAGFFDAGNVHIANALSVGATPGTFGASGQVLTSAGPGGAPTWTNAAAAVTASNGLTRTGNDIALGGTLTGNTIIANGGFSLNVTGTGNVGIGTTSPINAFHTQRALTGTAITTVPIARFANSTVNGNTKIILGTDNATADAFSNFTAGGSAPTQVLGFGVGNAVSTTTQLNLTGSGNVGIGTTNPNGFSGRMLHLSGTGNTAYILEKTDATARKWAMVTGGGGEFIIQDNTASVNAFSMEPGVTASQLYLRSGGNVGIGTSTPQTALDVVGTVVGRTSMIVGVPANGNQQIQMVVGSGFSQIQAINPSVAFNNLALNPNGGNVGIGTTSPIYPLQVNQTALYNDASTHGVYSNPTGFQASASNLAVGIYSSGAVLAGWFWAFSDARIKEKLSVSNTAEDLKLLMRLKVTDYSHIDKIAKGSTAQKGFIAQEVKEILPDAVNILPKSEFVPSIYSQSKSISKSDLGLRIELSKAHDLKVGDRVRLLDGSVEFKEIVTEIPTLTSFIVKNEFIKASMLFIYGKEISDMHTIDYDRIYTLGVSAIQELNKKLEAQQQVIDSLQAQDAESKKKIAVLEASLSKVAAGETELTNLKSEIEKIKAALGMSVEATVKKAEEKTEVRKEK